MTSKAQFGINAQVQEAWLVPRVRASSLPAMSQTDHTHNWSNTLEASGNSGDGNLPSVSTPHYRIKFARRIVQLVSLVISFPLFVLLVLSDMPQIIAVVLLSALFSSLIVGRAFCSWVCPLGTLYEFSRLRWCRGRSRPHCRIGCPFSLFMGLMNRFSLLKVKKLDAKCIHYGACDASCPVGLVELGSGYQEYQSNPGALCLYPVSQLCIFVSGGGSGVWRGQDSDCALMDSLYKYVTMKVIGLIGGMSWNLTLEYYRLINEMIATRLGAFILPA
jgi:ferredoxin